MNIQQKIKENIRVGSVQINYIRKEHKQRTGLKSKIPIKRTTPPKKSVDLT